jgi:allophanate hydrolase
VLKLGFVSGASYAYLAVEGGFAVPPFMNSHSTYTRAGLGGFAGRKLAAGDMLALARNEATVRSELAAPAPLPYGEGPIRVVWGPQQDFFTEEARATFLASDYTVSKEADRMGLRLDGPKLAHSKGADIVSDAIATGCIQVPGAGTPIVLLADHQTIGGYPKIATVASADLPRVGQLTPGSTLRFAAVTVAEAEKLRRDQEAAFARLVASLAPARPPGGIDLEALGSANLIDGMIDAQSEHDQSA